MLGEGPSRDSSHPCDSDCSAAPDDFLLTRTNTHLPPACTRLPLKVRATSSSSVIFSGLAAMSTPVQSLGMALRVVGDPRALTPAQAGNNATITSAAAWTPGRRLTP